MTSRIDPPGSGGVQMDDAVVTDDEPTPTTVRGLLTAAGLSDEQIEQIACQPGAVPTASGCSHLMASSPRIRG